MVVFRVTRNNKTLEGKENTEALTTAVGNFYIEKGTGSCMMGGGGGRFLTP